MARRARRVGGPVGVSARFGVGALFTGALCEESIRVRVPPPSPTRRELPRPPTPELRHTGTRHPQGAPPVPVHQQGSPPAPLTSSARPRKVPTSCWRRRSGGRGPGARAAATRAPPRRAPTPVTAPTVGAKDPGRNKLHLAGTCPVRTEGGTRCVQLVREGGGGARGQQSRRALLPRTRPFPLKEGWALSGAI